jgi:two-component system, NarL family, sensor kinase
MDSQETRIYSAVLITSIVLGVIIIFFVASIIRQQRRNLELHRKNILAEITTLEKERSRMAHDLHDELAPMLAAVKLKINSFELHDESDKEEMEKTNDHIDSLLKRIREITFDLMPNSLLRKGFLGAAHEFIEMISRNSQIEIRFKSEPIGNLSEQKTVNLYRILQEVVHNTVKHSGANVLHVSVRSEKGNIVLSTSDNGKGFNYDKLLLEGDGIGLRSLKSRIEIMNGDFFVESKKGKGTSYIFQIPQS